MLFEPRHPSEVITLTSRSCAKTALPKQPPETLAESEAALLSLRAAVLLGGRCSEKKGGEQRCVVKILRESQRAVDKTQRLLPVK